MLAAAIDQAAHDTAEAGPSSTVVIVREGDEEVEAAVLGDSTIMIGLADGHTERLTDGRITHFAAPEREHYRDRLRTGAGYDEHHRATLGSIQTASGPRATARPATGSLSPTPRPPHTPSRATARETPCRGVSSRRAAPNEASTISASRGQTFRPPPRRSFSALLEQLHRWESDADPAKAILPRAKPHDDKTLVI